MQKEIEIFAMLFAAAVHDFEHTGRGIKLVHPKSLAPSSTYRWLERPYSVLSLKGTTNNFHVQTKSRLAMIYNDRSVLENHHLSVAFRLLQNPDIDILDGLSSDEFKVPLTDLNDNAHIILPMKIYNLIYL